jgi:alpha-L-rhamnosidase
LGAPIAPAKIYEHNGKWVVDFGTTLTGWMRMRFSGLQPGQQVSIIYADSNNPAMQHAGTPDGFQSFSQEDAFVAGPSGSGEFCSKFNQHAFRYAVISGLPKAPEAKDVVAMMVETDLTPVGDFSCSNELFNQIHQVTVRTFHTQTPCGVLGGGEAREKLGYGDGGSFLTGFLYNLGSDAFYKKWLRDWCDGQTENGFLGHTAPEYYPAGGGPSWGGQASELTRRLDLYFGDTRAIESAYPVLKKYVDHLESHTDQDILRYFNPYNPGKYLEWYFLGDWNPPAESQDKHGFNMETPEQREFFNNCYRILLWQDLADFARRLGDTAEQKRCEERLAVLRPLVHKTFFDPEKNTYRVNRQAYLVIALRARIMPEELRPVIFKQLEHNIVVEKKGHLDCGLQGSYMLLDLLAQENRPDLAALIMGQETYPGWGFLLKERQVTTWPESWTGWGSQIIQVVATPGAWFYEGFAGIRPDPAHPGFKHFSIRPGIVDSVDWVKCHYDSPHGRIASNWKREGGKLTMEVTIPANTTATVLVPAKDAGGVTESAKPAGEAEGVKFLRFENNAAVYAVGSGTYQFQSQL